MEAPKRAYSIEIKIGADSRQDLIDALNMIEFDLHRNPDSDTRTLQSVSGGSSSGYNWKLEINESMTHEKYFELFELNEKYLEFLKERDKEQK